MRSRIAAAGMLSFVLFCSAAWAGDKSECAAASEYAQRLQKQGKLIDARGQLLICTRMECPQIVKQDCDAWLSTLDSTIPSLVIGARDEKGSDVLDLRVTLDGTTVDARSGRAIPVDPGMHKLRIEAEGRVPSQQQIIVREGERARPVTVTLAAEGVQTVRPREVVSAPRTTSPFVYILGTLAGVSLASFAAFEIKAAVNAADLRSTCAPRCDPDDVDRVSTDTVIANVSLALGAAFAGGAVTIWYLGRKSAPATTAVEVGPSRIGFRAAF